MRKSHPSDPIPSPAVTVPAATGPVVVGVQPAAVVTVATPVGADVAIERARRTLAMVKESMWGGRFSGWYGRWYSDSLP